MTLSNMLAYLAQVALIVLVCAGLPRALRLRAPIVQYAFWRVVLLVCLALPLIQPWRSLTFTGTTLAVASVTPSAIPFVDRVSTPATGQAFYSPSFDPILTATLVLAAGCAVRLLWLTIGIARLRSLRHAQGTEPADGFDDLSAAIGVTVPILWSPEVRHPVTFGVRRPVILLPVALKSVDPGAQRAVVAHELHHVVRRDWAWLLAEEVLRAVFWFHPAMWWLISRIQLARETVVDELSILVTNARRTYLDALLAFADDTGLGSPAFSARRHLFHRVMLLSKEGEMSSLRVAVGSGLLVVALGAGTWGAANAFPLYTEAIAQAQTPPRDPKTPPRDVSVQTYHRQAVEIWEQSRAAALTPDAQLDLIRQGIALEDKALAINPEYVEAMTYKNIFLRLEANLTPDAVRQRGLLEEANALRNKVIEIRKTNPYVPQPGEPPPPPPPPPPAGPGRAPITLSLDNAQLPTVLRFFGESAGLRVVADPSLSGLVTFEAVNVPWDDALRQILRPHGLTFEIADNTLTVRRLASPAPLARPTAQTSPTPRFMPPPPPPPPIVVTASDRPATVSVQTPTASLAAPMSAAFQRAVEMLQPLRVGGEIRSPVKTRDVKPVYPAEARGAGVQGVVVLEMLIDASGDVADVRVLRSIPLLDEAALGAVQQWRFTPTLVNGEPRSVLMTVTVSFRLP